MPAKTRGERLDRLEQVVTVLAERQISLEEVVAEFTTATRSAFDQVAEQFAGVGNQIKALAVENAKHSREMDDRVDKLVIAVGELIRKQGA